MNKNWKKTFIEGRFNFDKGENRYLQLDRALHGPQITWRGEGGRMACQSPFPARASPLPGLRVGLRCWGSREAIAHLEQSTDGGVTQSAQVLVWAVPWPRPRLTRGGVRMNE